MVDGAAGKAAVLIASPFSNALLPVHVLPGVVRVNFSSFPHQYLQQFVSSITAFAVGFYLVYLLPVLMSYLVKFLLGILSSLKYLSSHPHTTPGCCLWHKPYDCNEV